MTVVAVPEAPERLPGRTGGRCSQGVRLCLGMLRGALVGAHIGLVTAMGLALVGNGGVGAANAAIAGALVIVFFASNGKKLTCIIKPLTDMVECQNHIFQRLLFLAEFLGPLGVVPNLGILKFPRNSAQLIELLIVVKDTSAALWRAGRDPRAGWR